MKASFAHAAATIAFVEAIAGMMFLMTPCVSMKEPGDVEVRARVGVRVMLRAVVMFWPSVTCVCMRVTPTMLNCLARSSAWV